MDQSLGVGFEGFPSLLSAASRGESDDTPLIQVLDARIGKGESEIGGQEAEVYMTAVFKKYTTLEDTTFAFFKHNRRDFYVHFHADSHNRCETRLKPRLWDDGAYFKPALLKDGALRVIPHFLPQVTRDEASRKRPAPSSTVASPMSFTAPTLSAISTPQKRRQGLADAAPSSLLDITMTSSTPTQQKRWQEQPGPNTSSPLCDNALVDLAVETDDDELAEQEAYEQTLGKAGESIGMGNGHVRDNHDTAHFKPTTTSTLPADATYYAWLADFRTAKARYIAARLNGVTPDHRTSRDKEMHKLLHAEMIGGKYGMTALRPCSHCVKAGVACRVYHPACYEWIIPDTSSPKVLGWRCERCRNAWLSPKNGCNAQFDE